MLSEEDKKEVLDAIAPVLRGIVMALAIHRKSDISKLSLVLTGFASSPNCPPLAQSMFVDLAQCISEFDGIGKPFS